MVGGLNVKPFSSRLAIYIASAFGNFNASRDFLDRPFFQGRPETRTTRSDFGESQGKNQKIWRLSC
jgi:hypothetical protein